MSRPLPDHAHDDLPEDAFTRAFWDDRYRSGATTWSGNPNPHLVARTGDLVPGTALDVGSGDGSDAIWLASQGWRVTGADISTVALELGAERARAAGPEIAERITWQQADFLTWEAEEERFDLVTAQFMHLPGPALERLHRQLALAVRPGGTLLIVLHHPSDLHTTASRWGSQEMFRTPEQVVATLGDAWEISVAEAPERQAVDPDGQQIHIRDTVVRAKLPAGGQGDGQGSNR